MPELPINQNWTNSDGTHDGGVSTGIGFTISWQRGGLNEAGRNGAFLVEVLESCYNQLNYFQNSKYACEENVEALEHLRNCITSLEKRRSRRNQEGVLGTHELDKS